MRISEYPSISGLSPSDLFIIDTAKGTKTITSETLLHDISEMIKTDPISPGDVSSISSSDSLLLFKEGKFYKINPSDAFFSFFNAFQISKANRKMIRRRKFLGNSITEEQAEAINSGDFTDIYIGDYWNFEDGGDVIGEYYVADINRDRCSPLSRGYNFRSNIVLFRAISLSLPTTITFRAKKVDSDLAVPHFSFFQQPDKMLRSENALMDKVTPHSDKIELAKTIAGIQPYTVTSTSVSVVMASGKWYSEKSVIASVDMLDPKYHPFANREITDVEIGAYFKHSTVTPLALFDNSYGIFYLHGLATTLPARILTSGNWGTGLCVARFVDYHSSETPGTTFREILEKKGTKTTDGEENVFQFVFEEDSEYKTLVLPVVYTIAGIDENKKAY